MRSRRDQLQAYQFLRRRIVAALLSGEPDSPEAPMRRIVRTAFAGTMIAVLVAAGFGVFGVIRKGGATAWKKTDTIVIEKETAALYVWVAPRPGAPRELHPMINYASARLFLGAGTTKSVSRASLAGIPRAPRKGIADAPDSLPEPKDLIRDPWTVCSRTGPTGPEVSLLAGVQPSARPLGSDAGALVTDSTRRRYVVWRGQRFRVPNGDVLPALGFSDETPRVPGDAWLNALPQGRDLVFPAIPNLGRVGTEVGGRRAVIGEVFKVRTVGAERYAVALASGLAPISVGVAALLLADPRVRAMAYGGNEPQATEIGAAVYTAAARISSTPADLAWYPDRPLLPVPATSPDSAVLCATLSSAESTLALYAIPALPVRGRLLDVRDRARVRAGPAPADRVYLPAGAGALVRAQPQPGVSGTRFLITDHGVRFPITGDEEIRALGYEGVRVTGLPASFLTLLPDGPALSRQAAGRVVPVGAGGR